MRPTHVVVADRARARFFRREGERLEETEVLIAPMARLREHEIDADRPGAERGRHPMPPATSNKDHEATRFAKEVSAAIDRCVDDDADCRILLVAAPAFLGELRAVLSERGRAHVLQTADKDLSTLSVRDLEQRLPALLDG